MTNDQGDAGINELFRGRNRLVRIAIVVNDDQLNPLAQEAASAATSPPPRSDTPPDALGILLGY
jgi:hypothetical protein